MEKITTKAQLIELIEDIRLFEVGARDAYVNDIAIFHSTHITGLIKTVKDDEDKHIKMVDEILRVLNTT